MRAAVVAAHRPERLHRAAPEVVEQEVQVLREHLELLILVAVAAGQEQAAQAQARMVATAVLAS